MSHTLQKQKVAAIHERYAETKSIKKVSRELGVSRQAIRRHLNLLPQAESAISNLATLPSGSSPPLTIPIQSMLERLLAIAQGDTEEHCSVPGFIEARAKSLVAALGISSVTDLGMLEQALMQELMYRKAYNMARQAMNLPFTGDHNRRHDRPSLASRRYHETAIRAQEASLNILADLEIKYRRRPPNVGSGNVFICAENMSHHQLQMNNTQVNLGPDQNKKRHEDQ
jgi:hypothetical protein